MIKHIQHETNTLPCGLRIVCAPRRSQIVYCGIAVDAGTRDELSTESGMAHFTEHMTFKGTARRTARQIITRMESVGGDLNAYTGKEETVYYCTTLRPHLSRAVELLLDITLNSSYPQREMEREVEVVIDEIESYNDSPGELIYDDFEGLLFSGHPLGRNILGEAECLRQLRPADMKAFTNRLYRPERMVLFVYGDVDVGQVSRLAERYLQDFAAGSHQTVQRSAFVSPPSEKSRHIVSHRGTHQAHVMIGTRCFGAEDPRQLSLFMLNNMLGGPGMSSRLNMVLRERNGLVYTVESNLTNYTDTGVWSVYFGCDHKDVNRCLHLVLHELRRLADSPLSPRVIDAARRQLKGQIGISYDNAENVAIGMAKRFLHYGKTQTMEQLFARLDGLTAEQLWHTAQEVFAQENLLTLVYE